MLAVTILYLATNTITLLTLTVMTVIDIIKNKIQNKRKQKAKLHAI